jgi:hypothetical protein
MKLAIIVKPRTEQALAARDAALSILRTIGWNEAHSDGNTYLTWRSADFSLSLRTPFQRVPPISGHDIRTAAIHGMRLPKQLGYGLDIHRTGRGKVLNIEWATDGTVWLASFRRGTSKVEATSIP